MSSQETNFQANPSCLDNDIRNVELFYEYSGSYLDKKSKSIDDLNTRLTAVLGFSGLLLRFCIELPDGCLSVQLVKAAAILFGGLATLISALGLLARQTGNAPKPMAIVTSYFDEDVNRNKVTMGKTMCSAAAGLQASCQKKASYLNYAISLATASITAIGVNELLVTFFHKACVISAK